jgi:uncharacterized C2H2 Zn-finger protein
MGHHMFESHSEIITTELRRKYNNYATPIPPLSVNINDAKKDIIICLCCNNIWTNEKSYRKHIAKSSTCEPGNQIAELEKLIGKQFNAIAKTQTDKNALMAHIELLNKKIIKLEEIVLQNSCDISNLKLRLKNQTNIVSQPTADLPSAAVALPVTIITSKHSKPTCVNCNESDDRIYIKCNGKCGKWIHGINNEDDWPDCAKCIYVMCEGDDCTNSYCNECANSALDPEDLCKSCAN